MSRLIFSDDCPGCRPALIDFQTMKPVAADSRLMRPINDVWDKTTVAERQAFHRFTCQGSIDLSDLAIVAGLEKRMQVAADRMRH